MEVFAHVLLKVLAKEKLLSIKVNNREHIR